MSVWLAGKGKTMLFVGDDWAEDQNDVEVVGEDGRRLAARRVPEGPGSIAALHALVARLCRRTGPSWIL
jgi:hypothetical protein